MSRTEEVVISVRRVRKSYGDHDVLDAVSFDVRKGEVLALLGPNGAGKSTLMRILATLTTPDAGTAEVAGHDVRRGARAVRRRIGVAGQSATVDDVLTGRENLAMIAQLVGLPRKQQAAAISRETERFDLAEVIGSRVKTYSGGTRRRLDIAMSLIGGPRVLLMDEPTVGLDPRSRMALWDRIRSLADGGTAVLLTTQYLEEADQLADRIVLLDRGRVAATGRPTDLKNRLGASRLTVRYADGATETTSTDATLIDIREQLGHLDTDARPVAAIEVTPPSLDDVFLTLTGLAPERGDS